MWVHVEAERPLAGRNLESPQNGQVYLHLPTITAVISIDKGHPLRWQLFGHRRRQGSRSGNPPPAYYDPADLTCRIAACCKDRVVQALKSAPAAGFSARDFSSTWTTSKPQRHQWPRCRRTTRCWWKSPSALRAAVREGDTVSRQGGDEFVVLLENLSRDPGEAAVIAQRPGETLYRGDPAPSGSSRPGLSDAN